MYSAQGRQNKSDRTQSSIGWFYGTDMMFYPHELVFLLHVVADQGFPRGSANLLLPAATNLWPRLCFYSCLWFCPWGGGSASVHAAIPPPPGRRSPEKEAPPGRKHPLEGDPPEGDPPGRRHPSEGGPPPGRRHPLAYSQWAADTHPTGMHSCLAICSLKRYAHWFECIMHVTFFYWITWCRIYRK